MVTAAGPSSADAIVITMRSPFGEHLSIPGVRPILGTTQNGIGQYMLQIALLVASGLRKRRVGYSPDCRLPARHLTQSTVRWLGRDHGFVEGALQFSPAWLVHVSLQSGTRCERQRLFLSKGDGSVDIGC
jgi:hypothetical protein